MIVLIGSRGSRFADAVGDALRAAGAPGERVQVLDADAPFEGEPLTVAMELVRWRGAELGRARAIFLERPLCAWPQPIGGEARREVAALRLSALLAAAETARVLNPVRTAELALAPVLALGALAERGVPVHPWRFGPRAPDAAAARDAIGRVADYEPRAPEPGAPSWSPKPLAGACTTALVAGDAIAAAAERATLAEWLADDGARAARAPDSLGAQSDGAAALARRAARELGLDFAAVTLAGSGTDARVVAVDAAPELAAWNAATGGEVARAIAKALLAAAGPAREVASR